MLLIYWAKETLKTQCWGCGEHLERCLRRGIVSHPPGHGWAEGGVAPAAAEPRRDAPLAGYHCHGCNSDHVPNSPCLPDTHGDLSTAARC